MGGHGPNSGRGDFLSNLAKLASNAGNQQGFRNIVFGVLRNPNATGAEAEAQANGGFMPQLSGDDGDAANGKPGQWLSLTRLDTDGAPVGGRRIRGRLEGEPVPSRKMRERHGSPALEVFREIRSSPGSSRLDRRANRFYWSRSDSIMPSSPAGDVTNAVLCRGRRFFECSKNLAGAAADEVLTLAA